jgi:hypothetical protein
MDSPLGFMEYTGYKDQNNKIIKHGKTEICYLMDPRKLACTMHYRHNNRVNSTVCKYPNGRDMAFHMGNIHDFTYREWFDNGNVRREISTRGVIKEIIYHNNG